MNATTNQLLLLQRLPQVVARARERAVRLGRPVLASVTQPFDAASGLQVSPASGADCFLFEQPSRRFALSGVGAAARLVASGPERFTGVRAQLSRLLDAAVIESTAGDAAATPICLAGFSFDASAPHEAEWLAFPDALIFVPRLLLARRYDDVSLTANLLIDAETDVASAVENLRSELAGLTSQSPKDAAAGTNPLIRSPAAGSPRTVSPDDRDRWNDSVRALTQRIRDGAAEKVVLARRVELAAEAPFDLDAALDRLRGRYPDCSVFAVRSGDACFLGATPEMLVALNGRRVRTDCLAGSAARGATDADDRALGEALLADDKERREHALVTRGLEAALREVCAAVEMPAAPVLRRTASIQHLHTPIEATTDGDRHVLELVERLHPTAATAGLPVARSLCLLREHELFSRGWYAGPVGWLDGRGNGEFSVALRSALVRGNRASLYAGCGIVPGSDPEREYEESNVKLRAMSWALGATP